MDSHTIEAALARHPVKPIVDPLARKGDDATCYVYGMIGADVRAADFAKAVDGAQGAKTLTLRVNSPGGDVFEAKAMAAALGRFPGKVVAVVDGLAASAASYLVMHAGRVEMASAAEMMIHHPWTFTAGNASGLRAVADRLEKETADYVAAYQRKSGMPADRIEEMMSAETYLSAQEAVDARLADAIVGDQPRAAVSATTSIRIAAAMLAARNLREARPAAPSTPGQPGNPK